MPSQYNESELILDYFKDRVGRFLDIGAGDGLTFSNTECLIKCGWSGVMVEPSLGQLRWLLVNHGGNPRIEIVPAAVVPEASGGGRWATFYEGRDYSTLSQDHRWKIMQGSSGEITFRGRRAPTITWQELLKLDPCYPVQYDFGNIDVEGLNWEVLNEAPLELFEMVCVEIDPAEKLQAMKDKLRQGGLLRNTVVGGNLLSWR